MTDEAELVAMMPNDVSRCLPATECPRAMTCLRYLDKDTFAPVTTFWPVGCEAYKPADQEVATRE